MPRGECEEEEEDGCCVIGLVDMADLLILVEPLFLVCFFIGLDF